jgi:hypothetical protein
MGFCAKQSFERLLKVLDCLALLKACGSTSSSFKVTYEVGKFT